MLHSRCNMFKFPRRWLRLLSADCLSLPATGAATAGSPIHYCCIFPPRKQLDAAESAAIQLRAELRSAAQTSSTVSLRLTLTQPPAASPVSNSSAARLCGVLLPTLRWQELAAAHAATAKIEAELVAAKQKAAADAAKVSSGFHSFFLFVFAYLFGVQFGTSCGQSATQTLGLQYVGRAIFSSILPDQLSAVFCLSTAWPGWKDDGKKSSPESWSGKLESGSDHYVSLMIARRGALILKNMRQYVLIM